MDITEFDFPLPQELIAQFPQTPREESRLLVLHRSSGEIHHSKFIELDRWLREGDLLVVNDTRVIHARVKARKPTGGRVEVLLCEPVDEQDRPLEKIDRQRIAKAARWRCLVRARGRLNDGTHLTWEGSKEGILRRARDGRWVVELKGVEDVVEWLRDVGRVPLPPYIKREPTDEDAKRYQTIFARRDGSIAAPTAALHFSETVVRRLREKGVRIAAVTLHVGVGTFSPVRAKRVEEHHMESEYLEVNEELCRLHRETRKAGGRVIAVGTTTVRAMESAADSTGELHPYEGYTSLFIIPGYEFKAIDGLITNFHLPRSTPLMLVMAFAGREPIMQAYSEAIERRYRFFSYGDAMLIV
jgi:S-adenosylmethionine:tRNA ribosyltransferase-isomerase